MLARLPAYLLGCVAAALRLSSLTRPSIQLLIGQLMRFSVAATTVPDTMLRIPLQMGPSVRRIRVCVSVGLPFYALGRVGMCKMRSGAVEFMFLPHASCGRAGTCLGVL